MFLIDLMRKLRTLHHLSCSGGTIISKVIHSMKNVQVISEIHPHRLMNKFNPFINFLRKKINCNCCSKIYPRLAKSKLLS